MSISTYGLLMKKAQKHVPNTKNKMFRDVWKYALYNIGAFLFFFFFFFFLGGGGGGGLGIQVCVQYTF